jgi:hypothetical protein
VADGAKEPGLRKPVLALGHCGYPNECVCLVPELALFDNLPLLLADGADDAARKFAEVYQ